MYSSIACSSVILSVFLQRFSEHSVSDGGFCRVVQHSALVLPDLHHEALLEAVTVLSRLDV